MSRFDVWAPYAGRVRLSIDAETLEMQPRGGGWWTTTEPLPVGEVDYGYLLDDDEKPLSDPRSRRQPDGVHGRSRTFDAAAYAWTDSAWTGRQLAGAVLYELHVGTFTPEGTLDAALGRLDHLRDIGVDLVELMPVNAVNGTHNWGYDGVLWSAVNEEYGGPAAYQRFVDGCHAAGIGVVQDVVYNHLGPSGNYLPRFGPYLKAEGANSLGRAGQPRRRGQRGGSPLHPRQRGDVVHATSMSTRCGSTPCKRWWTSPTCTCWRSWPRRCRRSPPTSAGR